MSWFRGAADSNSSFTAEAREERRKKLEEERLERLNKRNRQKRLVELAVSSPSSPVVSRAPSPDRLPVVPESAPPSPGHTPVVMPDDQQQAAAEAAALRAQQMALPFEEQDFDDDSDAWKKIISTKFQRHDPEFWVQEIEAEMARAGINSQWSKRTALLGKDILPEDVVEELKPMFRLTKAQAGTHPYKDIKEELLSIFGKKDEQALEKAAARRLTTRPSALGKVLIHDICPGIRPFRGCHCARVVYYFFINQMPQVIKTQLAGRKFNADTYKEIFQKADDVFLSNKLTATAPVVAAVDDLNVTQPALSYPVEAVSTRGRGARGGRGQGRGCGGRGGRGGTNSNTTQNTQTKPPSSDAEPTNLCSMHKKWKKEAQHCRDPFVCEWAKFIKPRPSTNN